MNRWTVRSGAVLMAAVVLVGCDPAEKTGNAAGQGGSGQAAQGSSAGKPGASGQPARAPVDVTLTAVERRPIDETVEVTGTLFGDEEAVISTKIAGRISEIYVDVGDRVPAGGRLARIDPTDDELTVRAKELAVQEALAAVGLTAVPPENFDIGSVSTVERAQLQVGNAASKRERGEKLFNQQPPLISEQDFEDLKNFEAVAQKDYEVARLQAQTLVATARSKGADLAASKQRLADTTIVAPTASAASATPTTAPAADGRFAIAERRGSVGEYLMAGSATFKLVADDVVKFRTAVPERFSARVAVGQVAKLTIDGDNEVFQGVVGRVAPAVDAQSRTFQVEILVQNPKRRLRPGSFARGTIVTGQRQGVAFVPQNAVVTFAGLTKVFTVGDGKAVEHRVTLGTAAEGWVPLLTGFKDGEKVVVGGKEKLANDAPVKASE